MKIRCLVDQFDVSEGEIFELCCVRDHDGNPIESGDLAAVDFIEVRDKVGDWYPLLHREFEVIDE